jgi:hypothetical protein
MHGGFGFPRLKRLMSEPFENPNCEIDLREDERLALAAAEAIRRLIAERNALREHAAAQKRELVRVYRQIRLIGDSYRRLTLEFVTQLQHIDTVVANVLPNSSEAEGTNQPCNKSEKSVRDLGQLPNQGRAEP